MGIVASNNNDPRVRRLVAGPELRRAWLPAAALHGGMSVHAGSAVLRLLRAVFGPFSAVPGVGLRAFAALRGGSVALAVACSLLLSGCSKDRAGVSDPDVPTDAVTVGWRPGTLTVAGGSGDQGGWNARSAKGGASASRSADVATRADVPPVLDSGPGVDNPDDLPVGTTFRVLVYEAGADPQTDSPVAENTYKVADDQGTIVSTAVDGKGNAIEGDTREIVLRRGAYDFYYFSPAVAASTSMPNPGTYENLTNGADYMALVQRQEIDPSQGTKHYIPEVCFYRMGSYIDVRISPREGEVMGTLEVSGEGLQLWGLPKSGRYEVGEYPYRLTVEGEGGMVEFAPARFTAEEDKTATVSTLGVHGGRAVLPGYASELTVKVTLTSDGKELKLDAALPGYVFEPGYRYVVELGVGRIADKPELDVEILPWDEYDWGSGEIGGGYLRSAVVSPDGDIPVQGATYGITLEGFLPSSGVEVRARVDGQTEPLVSGKVTASGTPVELTIPANTGTACTVVFEYKLNGTWKKIAERTWKSRIGELYGGGVIYWVNPEDGNDFRVVSLDLASSTKWSANTGYVLGDGARDQTARNGADVWKLALGSSEGQLSGESGVFATDYPAFSYCYNKTDGGVAKGTWYLPSFQELRDLYSVKGSVESVITANGGTAFSAYYYWSATENGSDNIAAWRVYFGGGTAVSDTKTNSRSVRCVRGKGEVEPYVSSAAVSPDGDIPGGGGAYGITLKGLLPAGGVEVRANISGADPVTGTATTSGTPVELNIPANTTGAARTVVFEYKWNGTWVKIAERSQEKLKIGDPYGGGVVYWVDPADASDFRVVALDQSSSTLQWAAKSIYAVGSGADSETEERNGAAVWQVAKQYSDNKTDGASGTFATDFPAFSYCYEKTDGNVPEGTWYLPSLRELKDLYNAKGSVESVITANGGTVFTTGDYWSATEEDYLDIFIWTVNFSLGSLNEPIKTANSYLVRCIRSR